MVSFDPADSSIVNGFSKDMYRVKHVRGCTVENVQADQVKSGDILHRIVITLDTVQYKKDIETLTRNSA
jgi:hypothetical protein